MAPRKTPAQAPEVPDDFDDVGDDMAAIEEGDAPDVPADFDPDDPDGEFADPGWFQRSLGAGGVGNPRDAVSRTKITDRLNDTPIFAAGQVEGAVKWLVEVRNDETGQADYLGYAPLNTSMPWFLRRYIDAMPKPGADPVEFYFTPLDKLGGKLGQPGKPQVISVAPTSPELTELRKHLATSTIPTSGAEAALLFLREQLEHERKQREDDRKRLEEIERRERESHDQLMRREAERAMTVQNDLGVAYQRVGEIQTSGFTNLLTASDRMSESREKREDERRRDERLFEQNRQQREEADRKAELQRIESQQAAALERVKAEQVAERERRLEEARIERERIKAENETLMLRIKAENDARLKEMEIKATAEAERAKAAAAEAAARVQADIAKAEALLQAERLRIEAEREKEQQRLRDERAREEQRRTDDLAREERRMQAERDRDDRLRAEAEQRRIEEQARRDKLEADEKERREKAEAAELERSRAHSLALETLRKEAVAAQRDSMVSEQARQQEHVKTVLALIEKNQGKSGEDNPLGTVGTLLNALGITPSDAFDKVKGFVGGNQTGFGATIVQELGALAREVVKRLPEPTDDEEEEEVEEEEVEEVPQRQPRRIAQNPVVAARSHQAMRAATTAARAASATSAPPVSASTAAPRAEAPPASTGPGLDAFLGKRTPDPDPDTAAPAAETSASTDTAAPPEITAVDLDDIRRLRQAVAPVADALEDADPEEWATTLMGHEGVDAFAEQIGRVGLTTALDGYDIDLEKLGAVLVKMGMFEKAPMTGDAATERS